MIYQIASPNLTAKIDSNGAELVSLVDNSSQQEFIWQADPSHWGRHAPVLFPIVGRLKDDEFVFEGKSYTMKQHGFARDMEFEKIAGDDRSCEFLLTSNDETLNVYPFQWDLYISYSLTDNALTVEYKVINKSKGELWFSLGTHPAFNCPLSDREDRSDYSLLFNKNETKESQLIVDGIRTNETKKVFSRPGELQIVETLFDQDALIFSDLVSSSVSLSKGDQEFIKVEFEGFPYLGIWSKNRTSPFVCIEPWYGIADHQSHDKNLKTKEGINKLNEGGTFTCFKKIEII